MAIRITYNQEPNNSNYLCRLRALCGDQDHTPQRTQRAQSVQDICQRYYILDYNIALFHWPVISIEIINI
jgi:hypothetical protein